jgi:hypothetical protein
MSVPRRTGDSTSLDHAWKDWVIIAGPNDSPHVAGSSTLQVFNRTLRADITSASDEWSGARYEKKELLDLYEPDINPLSLNDRLIDKATCNRRLIISSRGYMGLAPFTAQTDDKICILFGSQMPSILRKEILSDRWLCVGQAYIHGIMDGEALNGFDMEDSETFEII